ncbi:MAG: leucyl aminopeptidase [Pseudomonadota bacterium]|nr:leucyl aminopeptidase [Pseudomonadota bacterium]
MQQPKNIFHRNAENLADPDVIVMLFDNQQKLLSDIYDTSFRPDALQKQLETICFSGKSGECAILATDGFLTAKSCAICLGVGAQDHLDIASLSSASAKLAKFLASKKIETIHILYPSKNTIDPSLLAKSITYGIAMADYCYQDFKKSNRTCIQTIHHHSTAELEAAIRDQHAINSGQLIAKDLMHCPPNVLYPMTFAERARDLESHGVTVNVLGDSALEEENMHALLAVGMGSAKESALVTMYWPGTGDTKAPIALVGKGICYDSGGINLKSAMQVDMKYDMGGAACVMGAMLALAMNRCPHPVVGVLALAENMPGGKATRPSDILSSRSGKTINVLNTDAEGRLVLADAIDYTLDHFKPRCIIDTATLTGAMIVGLGYEYAGLFSNHDPLADGLLKAGQDSHEKLWRMPLDAAYDKMIDSSIADVQNLGTPAGVAGSITAAQFIQRFARDTPWAHIDIAGTAWIPAANSLHEKGPTGYGVKLLYTFCLQNDTL